MSDLNEHLINAYKQVRDNPRDILRYLQKWENTEEKYYEIRASVFKNQIKQAARFIYLNQYSFNGIYRENRSGKYNVPYGKRKDFIINFLNIFKVSRVLQDTEIFFGDFTANEANINKNDLVFLDPPYSLSQTEDGFVKYNKDVFSIADQYKLADFIDAIRNKGAKYILTNANHPKIIEIFDNGDNLLNLSRNSTIGGISSSRGIYKEIILTNC